MYRYFISQYPTFGSYKKPKPYLVEASPYFWWWYALTLNETYTHLCEMRESGALLTESETDFPEAMLQVYEDFGDVRYEGCRYRAFAQWWRELVSTGETRGEYLFAEPQALHSVKVLKDKLEFEKFSTDSYVVIAVPKDMQRSHIDKAFDKVIKKHVKVSKGKEVRAVANSKARYSVSKHLYISAIKTSLELYDAKIESVKNKSSITNIGLARSCNLTFSFLDKYNMDELQPDVKRKISVSVSRYIKNAKDLISNVGEGVFDY